MQRTVIKNVTIHLNYSNTYFLLEIVNGPDPYINSSNQSLCLANCNIFTGMYGVHLLFLFASFDGRNIIAT